MPFESGENWKGNRGGRPRSALRGLAEALRAAVTLDEAVAQVRALLESDLKPSERLAALGMYFDRAFGRPTQTVDIEALVQASSAHDEPLDYEGKLTVDEIRTMRALELKARAAARDRTELVDVPALEPPVTRPGGKDPNHA